jgi:hypothetical protein
MTAEGKEHAETMNWRAAARAAFPYWLFLVLAGLGLHAWDGMITYYGWPEYVRRFLPAVALLYGILAWAVRDNARRYERRKPQL